MKVIIETDASMGAVGGCHVQIFLGEKEIKTNITDLSVLPLHNIIFGENTRKRLERLLEIEGEAQTIREELGL